MLLLFLFSICWTKRHTELRTVCFKIEIKKTKNKGHAFLKKKTSSVSDPSLDGDLIDSLSCAIILYNCILMSTFRSTYLTYVTYNEHIYTINTPFIHFSLSLSQSSRKNVDCPRFYGGHVTDLFLFLSHSSDRVIDHYLPWTSVLLTKCHIITKLSLVQIVYWVVTYFMMCYGRHNEHGQQFFVFLFHFIDYGTQVYLLTPE